MVTFAILDLVDPESNQYDLKCVIGTVKDQSVAQSLIARIEREARRTEHRLTVVSVDSVVYDYRIKRTGGEAKPVEPGMSFKTATEASRHMGYRKNNQVANRMGKARRAGKDTVTICGVTLRRDELVRIDPST